MLIDGTASFAVIEHMQENGHWTTSALDHFLFADLTYDQKRERGDELRALLAPQSANSDLWQRFGIHGFPTPEDAEACLAAVIEQHPDREFRIVWRTITQETKVLATSREQP